MNGRGQIDRFKTLSDDLRCRGQDDERGAVIFMHDRLEPRHLCGLYRDEQNPLLRVRIQAFPIQQGCAASHIRENRV